MRACGTAPPQGRVTRDRDGRRPREFVEDSLIGARFVACRPDGEAWLLQLLIYLHHNTLYTQHLCVGWVGGWVVWCGRPKPLHAVSDLNYRSIEHIARSTSLCCPLQASPILPACDRRAALASKGHLNLFPSRPHAGAGVAHASREAGTRARDSDASSPLLLPSPCSEPSRPKHKCVHNLPGWHSL